MKDLMDAYGSCLLKRNVMTKACGKRIFVPYLQFLNIVIIVRFAYSWNRLIF